MSRYVYECPVCHTEETVEVEVRGVGRTPTEVEVVGNCCELNDEQRASLEDEAWEDALCGK
jgi:hypothetical protein